METLNNIQFNTNLFSQFNPWIISLYEIDEGLSLFIKINNIDLLTFTRHFDEIIPCEDFIKINRRKTFVLWTFSNNIETWLWNNNPIPDNLDQIIIFCLSPDDKQYFQKWTRRYTRKVRDVITYDKLERHLLLFGMEYINDLCLNFNGNQDTLRTLREYQERIRVALVNAFAQAANNL